MFRVSLEILIHFIAQFEAIPDERANISLCGGKHLQEWQQVEEMSIGGIIAHEAVNGDSIVQLVVVQNREIVSDRLLIIISQ